MLGSQLRPIFKAVAEPRVAARQLAARDLQGAARMGAAQVSPVSTSLFNREATTSAIASQPPVITVDATNP